MKRLLFIALLALTACDDQPRQKVEQILPHKPVKRVKITMQNVMHLTHTPNDGTTPQQIAQAAIEMLRETNPQ